MPKSIAKNAIAISLIAFAAACAREQPEEEVVYVEPEPAQQPTVAAEPTYTKN